ncbi:MAG: outer membrane protein transport protein [Verrucomicrobiota bacterium]|nr:outer membrane protein transport protein [Verrucomicrobiota bacterium]
MAFVITQLRRAFLACALFLWVRSGDAAGLLSDGSEARSAGIGGTEAAQSGSALAAMDSNPAALTSIDGSSLELNWGGAFLRGRFSRDTGENAGLEMDSALLPAAAFTLAPPRGFPVTFGVAIIPEVTAGADWRYRDALGGLGGTTTYGDQTNRSTIVALRSQLGVGVEVTHWLSVGASGGVAYDHNSLHAPYIFQSQRVLAGFKTLLDLEADGFAPSFDFGAQVHPSSRLTLGASYRPSSTIETTGHASGNASAQLQALGGGFAQAEPNFHYDAEVRTVLPQVVSTGAEWQALDWLRLVDGIDWVNWSRAFDQLEIRLTRGSNSDINAVVGADSMTDVAPLRWRDQFVYRAGMEFALPGGFTARTGYSYARSAVPLETLTPLTAAIFEHKLAAGIGYRTGRYHADLAWQWSLPVTQHVECSALLSDEYSRTSVRVSGQSLQLSTGIAF